MTTASSNTFLSPLDLAKAALVDKAERNAEWSRQFAQQMGPLYTDEIELSFGLYLWGQVMIDTLNMEFRGSSSDEECEYEYLGKFAVECNGEWRVKSTTYSRQCKKTKNINDDRWINPYR